MSTTDCAVGMRMLAEWAPHELTLIAWPAREDAWRDTTIEDGHAATVAGVAAFEPVLLVAKPEHVDDARRRVPAENVEVVGLPIDDSWLRDSGPIIVVGRDAGGAPARAGVDFRFNAWGEAFTPYDSDAAITERLLERLAIGRIASPLVLEGGSIAVDGEGLLITTEQCLLNPNRKPAVERASGSSKSCASSSAPRGSSGSLRGSSRTPTPTAMSTTSALFSSPARYCCRPHPRATPTTTTRSGTRRSCARQAST